MNTKLTPEQRASRHISTTCPACKHEVLMGASRYEGVRVGSFERCPWCETMLVVSAMAVTCEIDPRLATKDDETPACPTDDADEVEGARAAIAAAYSPADHGGVST